MWCHLIPRFATSLTGQDRLFGAPYVSRHTVCYVPVTSGQAKSAIDRESQAGTKEWPELLSFALLAIVLVVAALALVFLVYYLLRRWL
jgi:hypothetical protein